MKRMLKGVLVKVDGTNEVIEIEDTLKNLYQVCDCECIDIISRRIGGKVFDIVLDDEGLLKEKMITAMREDRAEILVGNLFVVKNTGKGNLKGLNQEEIDHVRSLINKDGLLIIDKPTKKDREAMKELIEAFGGNVIRIK